MTTAPVASINDELLDEIQYRAEYCEREVIRSHPWRDMDLDVLAADERFIRSATPANVHAIITELRTLRAENAALAKDAGRYRWLRETSWYDSQICAVRDPAKQVKPGSDCPSRHRLDLVIDSLMQEPTQ